MRPPLHLATTAVLAAALLAGCSGDDAEPGAGPTESASSTPTGTDSAGGGSGSGTLEGADPSATGSATAPSGTDTGSTGGASPTPPPPPPGAVATGAPAEGFPTDVVPLLPDSTITVSTVTPLDGSRTLSLSGTTATPADQVQAFYRTALVAQGFVETAGPQVAGFPTSTFSRNSGADLLVLSVTTLEGVQSFTIGGALAG